MQKIVLVDVDYVTADLHTEWYRRYNKDYDDNLTAERVTDWYLHNFVKPECGLKIYDYLTDPSLYDNVNIVDGAKNNIDLIKYWGVRVVFLTSGINAGKYHFLHRHGLVKDEGDFVVAHDKSLVIGNFLVDDYFKNILSFYKTNPYGYGILFNAPHNRSDDYPLRVDTWDEVSGIIRGKLINELGATTL